METKSDKSEKTQNKYLISDPGFGGLEIRNLDARVIGHHFSMAGFQVRSMLHSASREYAGWIKSETDVFPFIVSFAEYDASRDVYPVRVAFSTGGNALIANITVSGGDTKSVAYSVSGDVPDIAAFGRAIGQKIPTMPKMTVDFRGTINDDKVHFDKSLLTTRGTELNFDGDYDWTRGKVVINLNATKINLYELLPELFGGAPIDANRELNVFHDMPLYGDILRDLRMDVRANIGNLIVYRNLQLKKLNLSAGVADAHGLIDMRTDIADGTIRIAAHFDIDDDGRLHITTGGAGQKINIGTLLNQINIRDFISGLPVNLELYLQGAGRDISELMQNISGPVQMFSVGTGYAHSQLVANIYGTDFLTTLRHEIQDLFRSEKKHDRIKISCVAVNTKIRDGLIETQNGVAAETAAINIGLSGDLDLGRERIKMSLATVPVRGLKLSLTGNVVNSISINGNMAEPDVTISGAAVAGKVASATGIGLLLTPLTGGIGLVAGAGVGLLAGDLLENWLADDNPCETAMLRGAPSRRRDVEWLNEPIEDLIAGIFNETEQEQKIKGE